MNTYAEPGMTRARRCLRAAHLLLEHGEADESAGSSYHAMLSAASAALAIRKLRFKKHTEVHAAFHRHFVQPDYVDERFDRSLRSAFAVWMQAAYEVDQSVQKEDATKLVRDAEEFVAMVTTLLEREGLLGAVATPLVTRRPEDRIDPSPEVRRLLEEYKHGLEVIYGDRLVGVYLFGSRARGDHEPDSDVDMLIVLRDFQSYWAELRATGGLTSDLTVASGLAIGRVFMKQSDWLTGESLFLLNVRSDAVPA